MNAPATLNSDQRRAAEYPSDAALLVIAGAGSGKTNTLAHRVAHLVLNGVDPRRILLLTFSRRAAAEMTRRVERIVAQAMAASAQAAAGGLTWSGTFHGVGARLLRIHAEEIGLDPSFTIHDRGDSADLINLVRHELGFSNTARRFPLKATCLAIYSRAVNEQAALEEVLRKAYPWCADWEEELRALFAGYVEAKQRQNVLDYDDLLLYLAEMLNDPTLGTETGARFDHVLVDEYQDTNRLQSRILLSMKPTGRGLTVVGDDAQSIYSFRAATVRNILDFPDAFSPPAGVVTLARNYRSTSEVLAASNAVIGLARERYTKDLWTERPAGGKPRLVTLIDDAAQANYVADAVLENRETGTELKQQAVLFRASHHSGPLEIELTRRKIPFVKFGGLKFLDARHVKDVLAMLRLAENPRDRVAGFRVLQLIPGIGPATAARALDIADQAPEAGRGLGGFAPPAAAAEHWPAFSALIDQLGGGQSGWPADLEQVRQWYEPHLERIFDDAAIRRADLIQLEQIATGYASRERFLTELTLDPPGATSDEAGVPHLDEDYLILSTIHSAKGQEWKSVFVLNCIDGCIPSDLGVGTSEEIEEERRLLYVAMTRARDHLDLIVPQRCYVHHQARRGDRHVTTQRTRFIPDRIVDRFQPRLWPPVSNRGAARRPNGPRIDIGARMRQRWATR
ncbi:MAG: ATP-dependent helicase [Hyphomicrobiales bacterium]|nr:ATP-dependent helicase [Hyphomicrobiales bacterium]